MECSDFFYLSYAWYIFCINQVIIYGAVWVGKIPAVVFHYHLPLESGSILLFSHPRSEGWLHHGCTFSVYFCPVILIDFYTGSLYTYWSCLFRPCVLFFACMHLALFLALSLFPGNSVVSSWCDRSRLAFCFDSV